MTVEKRESLDKISPPTGQAIDRSGGPVIDPTANVLALVQAAVTRLDDLRALEVQRQVELRMADQKRADDLRMAESKRLDEQASLRAEFQAQLALAEANRINAIRAVDVAAVGTASERAAQQAAVLATQLAQSADTLRGLVATTASAQAATLQSIVTTLTDRIASLEKAQYENKGKSGVSDPAIDLLSQQVAVLNAANAATKGQGVGAATVISYIIGGVGLIGGVIGIVIALTR